MRCHSKSQCLELFVRAYPQATGTALHAHTSSRDFGPLWSSPWVIIEGGRGYTHTHTHFHTPTLVHWLGNRGNLVTHTRRTLCNPMDCSLLSSSVRGIFQARILDWVPWLGWLLKYVLGLYLRLSSGTEPNPPLWWLIVCINFSREQYPDILSCCCWILLWRYF